MVNGNDTEFDRLRNGPWPGAHRLDRRAGGELRLFHHPPHRVLGMTAAELTDILNQITLQLGDIMSFGLGALCGIAFVIASSMRWEK